MEKRKGYLAIAVYFLVMFAGCALIGTVPLSVSLQISLWLVLNLLFGFVLPILHGRTRTLSGLLRYVVIVDGISLLSAGLLDGFTPLRLVEAVIALAAPVLGWLIWDKTGRPGGATTDIER